MAVTRGAISLSAKSLTASRNMASSSDSVVRARWEELVGSDIENTFSLVRCSGLCPRPKLGRHFGSASKLPYLLGGGEPVLCHNTGYTPNRHHLKSDKHLSDGDGALSRKVEDGSPHYL